MTESRLFYNHVRHIWYSMFTSRQTLVADCRKYNLKFKFHIKDGVGRDIYYKKGVYSEDYITSFLIHEAGIKNGDLVIDVGANIGWYSLVLSTEQRPEVLAFEPDNYNFSLLKDNIGMNELSNIHPFNLALSDKPGTQTFYLYKKYNLGRHSFIKQKNSINKVEVETARLDDFLKERGYGNRRVRLIKMDIEGHEFSAATGAKETLLRTDYLLTEFTPALMNGANQDPMDYIRLLETSGFAIYSITPEGLSEPDFKKIISGNQQVNLFCAKK